MTLARGTTAVFALTALTVTLAGPAAAVTTTGDRVWRGVANPLVKGTGWLEGAAAASGTDVWTVGVVVDPETGRRSGIVPRWTGSAWQFVPPAPAAGDADVRLSDVDVLPDGGAVAVGSTRSGASTVPRIERFPAGGGRGVQLPGPAPEGTWQGVDIRTGTDGWAVGGAGPEPLIAHWDGESWQRVPAPGPGGLTAVTALAADDAWAVGSVPDTGKNLVLHWDGSSWRRVDAPSPGNRMNALLGVAAAGPGDIWLAGLTEGSVTDTSAVALHLSGGAWQTLRSTQRAATQYSDVLVVSPTDVVLGGYQETLTMESFNIEHWDGTTLRRDKTFPDHTNNGLASALSAMTAEPDGGRLWAVGWATTTVHPEEQPAALRSDH